MTTRNELRADALCECCDMLSITEYLMSEIDVLTEYAEMNFRDAWTSII